MVVAPTAVQERLASLLGRAYVLAGTEVTGTVDGGGYLTPFDPTAVVALDLQGHGLPLVGPGVLPAPDPRPRERASAELGEEVERRRADLRRLADARDHVARLRAATEAAVSAGTEERDGCRARLDDLAASQEALLARPHALAAERTGATEAAEVADVRLQELRAVREELGRALGPSEDGATLRIGDDTSALRALVERAGGLGGVRSEELGEALAWLERLSASTVDVRPDALGLIAEIENLELAWQQAAQLGIEGDPEVRPLAAERAELDGNHRLLVGLASSGLLGDTAKAEIDAAHVEVLQAGRSQASAAAAKELEVLARYGFDSYLEYTIATSTRSVGQAVQSKLDDLTHRIEQLDAALATARSHAAGRIEDLAARREPAQERVTAFLGHRPSGSAIDALARVPDVPHSITRLTLTMDEAIEAARDELGRYRDTLVDLDDEERTLEVHAAELDDQRAQLESRVADLDEVLGRAAAEVGALTDRLGSSEAELARVTTEVAALSSELDRLSAGPTDAYGRDDVGPVVDAVLDHLDPWSPTPAPAVLCDTFSPMPDDVAIAALEAVVARAEHNQLLYLTADPAMRAWADRLDPGIGRLIELDRGRWSPRRLGRKVLGRRASE